MRTRLLLTGKGLLLAVSLIAGAESEKEVFRKDVFVRNTDGYHTYRIPTMVVTSSGAVLVFVEGRKTHRSDHGDCLLYTSDAADDTP